MFGGILENIGQGVSSGWDGVEKNYFGGLGLELGLERA